MAEAVNHPNHYNRDGSMECIEEMLLLFGVEKVKAFCICNAWKYRYRAADKNGAEDLKKSDWYIAKYNELSGDRNIAMPAVIETKQCYTTTEGNMITLKSRKCPRCGYDIDDTNYCPECGQKLRRLRDDE